MNIPDIRLIAMYLPQYHPIPENNRWWGEGFTEWTNVRKAEPRFPGHYQPHVPGELGYYDLRDPAARRAQAELARAYGIHGFCYYHYWFNGKRLLETPFNEVLRTGEPDFPFCLCWANENWTRRWDGADQEVLMAQHYSDEDSLAFINDLVPAFRDERYIRVNGKPLLLVYRTGLLPDPKRTAEIWREAMRKNGIGELYLVRVENHMDGGREVAPADIGFDAAMEFAPYWASTGNRITNLSQAGLEDYQLDEDVIVVDYDQCMRNMLSRPEAGYKLFRGIFPMWDNSARRKKDPLAFVNSSPEKYAFWLSCLLNETDRNFVGDERLVFVNAWNEWGEGCHLEPDQKQGTRYLEATRNALAHFQGHQQLFEQAEKLPDLAGEARECVNSLIDMIHYYKAVLDNSDLLLRRTLRGDLSNERICSLNTEISSLRNIISIKQKTIDDLLNSLSWKITKPLRLIHSKLSGHDIDGRNR